MVIYRYLEETFLKNFFEKGNLRLGSFSKYRTIENETRKDPADGSIIWISNGDYILTGEPPNVLIMCFSLEKSKIISDKFKVKTGFSIDEKNIDRFIAIVGKELDTFIAFSGQCDYIEESIFPKIKELYFDKSKIISDTKVKIYPKSDALIEKKNNLKKMYDLSEKNIHFFNGYNIHKEKEENIIQSCERIQAIFNKRDSYNSEKEYRIAWLIDNDKEINELNICSLDLPKICKCFEL